MLTVIYFTFQLILLRYFDIAFFKSSSFLYDNVVILNTVCIKYQLQCVLMDIEVLKLFLRNEIEHRKLNHHNHEDCRIFCQLEKHLVTFMVQGRQFSLHRDVILRDFTEQGFKITVDDDADTRELSIERRRSKNSLIFHLFLERNDRTIHLVFSYKILNHEWTNKCNYDKLGLLPNTLSVYGRQENLYQNLEFTSAVIDNTKFHIPQYLNNFIKNINSFHYKPCNYQQARLYYSTYGYDSTKESEIFRTKATNMLTIAVNILQELKIPFWLSSGTCLGWFRQCGFIPHSKDVDIGINIKNYKAELIHGFRNQGFLLKHKFGVVNDSFELSFIMDELKLDIFFFYEELDYIWNGGTQVRTGKKFKYIFQKFELCWTRLLDLLVRVPCETKDYILSNYGENWNTPVKIWDWKASPPNVRENGEWPAEERIDVIQTYL